MSDFAKLLEIALEAPPPAGQSASRTVKREDGTVVTINTRNPLVGEWPQPAEAKAEPAKPAEPPRQAAPPPKR